MPYIDVNFWEIPVLKISYPVDASAIVVFAISHGVFNVPRARQVEGNRVG